MTTTATTTAKLFLTDYASYNNGTQFEFGHYINLEDFDTFEDLQEYISNHFKECDDKSPLDDYGSKREETMFTDFEGFPRELYNESGIDEETFNKIKIYIQVSDKFEDNDSLIELHNEFCSNTDRMDDYIYQNDEDFFNTYFDGDPDGAVRAAIFGSYNYGDDYVIFNGYGNLETFDAFGAAEHIDEALILEDIYENPENYNI